jgi:hypothetical protein
MSTMSPRRGPRPHPQIHLPPLGAAYALTLVDILDRISDAIWRAHGDRMTHLLDLRRASLRRPSRGSCGANMGEGDAGGIEGEGGGDSGDLGYDDHDERERAGDAASDDEIF